ncbi:hypothetical protein HDU93_001207 [Gonapodya sp. JEL0774]|nr:hypothetical protein HDU93_001207 [Gonapodya sp. JEL0774]
MRDYVAVGLTNLLHFASQPKEAKPKADRPKKEKKERAPREPSTLLSNFNLYVFVTYLAPFQEAFKVAAANWKTSASNPANA